MKFKGLFGEELTLKKEVSKFDGHDHLVVYDPNGDLVCKLHLTMSVGKQYNLIKPHCHVFLALEEDKHSV